ncbi:hypothetical protein [Streptomyces sp. NBC_01304]|uniref:hypothetical protein n=1 Tax=Streptomyces sp. NBC_01304 TaxID=2903818 RepID=UPI002E148BB3|nr:hypothetical protein OG430_48015 [Streptomyces sp. NBC_01304]
MTNHTPEPARGRRTPSPATRAARSRMPPILRRLDPPRNAAGQPDYRPPAAVLAVFTAFVAMFTGFHLALASKFWHHHQHFALAAVYAGALLAAAAVYHLAHRLLARTGLYLWQSALAGVVLLVVMSSAYDWAHAIFPRALDRYEAELGGPGRCLHSTPYDLNRSQSAYDADHPGRLIVDPLEPGLPALRLDNAVDGGIHHLTPANRASRKILTSYGC